MLIASSRPTIRTKSLLLMLTLLLSIGLSGSESLSKELPLDTVVATVDAQEIPYKRIHYREDSLELLFRLRHGHDPTATDTKQLQAMRVQEETKLLKSRVHSIIRDEVINEFGINVSNDEVMQAQQKLFAGVNRKEAVAQQKENLEPLIQALKAVSNKQMDSRAAYETYLKSKLPYEQWLVHVQYYNTPQKIKMLEDLANQKPEDWDKPDPGIKSTLVEDKLNHVIDLDIAKKDEKFQKYLVAKAAKDSKSMSEIEGDNPLYVEAKRQQWWNQRTCKANIHVLVPEFQGVVKDFNCEGQDPSKATSN